jgi:hypothetical protein
VVDAAGAVVVPLAPPAAVVDVEEAPFLYRSSLFGPPQYSRALPSQVILQSPVLARTLPALSELPQ